jgi:hypothetical protein
MTRIVHNETKKCTWSTYHTSRRGPETDFRSLYRPRQVYAFVANDTVARTMQVHHNSSRAAAMLMLIPFLITLAALFLFLACV